MSADNGVYILKTPARPVKKGNALFNRHGVFEYRIAHCQAIDNLDYSDIYMPLLFGNSKVHENEEDAIKEAKTIHDDLPFSEYGICLVEKRVTFPNMTSQEAYKAINSYIEDENFVPK